MKQLIPFILLSFFFGNCCRSEDGSIVPPAQKKMLVDKIYDYNNNLVAVYQYNEKHQLTKRIFTDSVNGNHTEHDFKYENGKVKNIIYTDYRFPQFNHNMLLFYDSTGNITRDETYQNNTLISYRNYNYYTDGKIKSITDASGLENFFVDYKNAPNALRVKVLVPDNGGIANAKLEYREVYRNFLYDTNPKPDFGLGNVFQVEPLPSFGDEALFEKNISQNNMTTFVESGTKWIYEYDNNGYPVTIETRWKDITHAPIMLRIHYREVN